VQRLLAIAESVQRLRPLMQEAPTKGDARRRVALEIERIGRMVGI
jgi:hypothetical protein